MARRRSGVFSARLAWLVLGASLLRAQDPAVPAHPLRASPNTLFYFLEMSGAPQGEFRPLTQDQRARAYVRGLLSPFAIVQAAASAGLGQWRDVPRPWGQEEAGYSRRLADYLGREVVQHSLRWGLESVLHEDNRYFQSGRTGAWGRVKYALASSVLARKDSGSRCFSLSQVGSLAGTAFLSRTWQPATDSSPEHGAISFGIALASNAGMHVFKEFLPDLLHRRP